MKFIYMLMFAALMFCGCEGDHDDHYDHHDYYRGDSYHYYHPRYQEVEVVYVETRPYYWSEQYDDYVYTYDDRVYYYRNAMGNEKTK